MERCGTRSITNGLLRPAAAALVIAAASAPASAAPGGQPPALAYNAGSCVIAGKTYHAGATVLSLCSPPGRKICPIGMPFSRWICRNSRREPVLRRPEAP